MITIGLTTWSDHPALINDEQRKVKLNEYTGFFPTVEVDNPFYGIPRLTTIKQWQHQVPKDFQFVIKANKLMTKHDLKSLMPANDEQRLQAFVNFKTAMQPLLDAGQLKTILFQFPPYFQRNNDNIRYLIKIRKLLGKKMPITVEFRNPSWTEDGVYSSVLQYLKRFNMTLAIVDEPHNLNNGIAFKPVITTKKLAFLRLHGRNEDGWFHQGKDWRSQRTLYRYNDSELKAFADSIKDLEKQVDEVCIIFNNNSGKDAAPNALNLKDLLNLHFKNLAPKQLDLF
ncbi:DUF72 domain-containing protein [Apilactobacillus micheneri]|uniref:DUF72 domain-containing protein n=1 Tax=Apilactobacillus micheneri TaxID=1899430 RepID=UPI000D047FE9|nr:DUF72 domain-containing protein [Apilactobacillus micheneri]TPR34514.1 DUF72 domain-containing protein [Apilactobacillus micheneri]TPR38035.1 DUF72 domain-containing protein [Apilactobacillus micheneri]